MAFLINGMGGYFEGIDTVSTFCREGQTKCTETSILLSTLISQPVIEIPLGACHPTRFAWELTAWMEEPTSHCL